MQEDTKLKQVIVMRNDLNMRKGKMVAQGAHASLGAVLFRDESPDESGATFIRQWIQTGMAKICVRCDSEKELTDLAERAKEARLLHFLVHDAGRTEFHGVVTPTSIAIGPGPVEDIDALTGKLKLL